ncbi:MFS transporter [Plantactinospora sp. BB1]|uniref:MFS transporter n=1 Tax=Plantactinospora sp. BB1 TaxID=2071627 RepID=UPI000D17B0DE|nr:MFS transporter [Plantactinospora sp. BB1]AVT41239.1 MFS transporter [Plantactinospora sp. BB1]
MTATPEPATPEPATSEPAGTATRHRIARGSTDRPPVPPRGPLWILLLASTLTVLAGAVLAPVVELLRADLGVSAGAAGLVLTAHGLSLALVGPLVGRAVDRWGVSGPLGAGLVLYGLAGGAGLLLDDYLALVASRLVFGIGAAAVFTGSTLGLLDLAAGAAARDRMMGWRSAAISLGGVLWPLLGGALGTISWHAPFAVYLVGVPLGLVALRMLSTMDRHRPGSSVAASRSKSTTGAKEEASGAVGHAAPARPEPLLRGRPRLLGIYALQAVATALLYGVLVFLPPRLAEVGVRDSFRVALFGALLSLVMSLTGLRFARVRARLGWSGLLLLAFGAWTVALVLLALGTSPVPLLLAPAVFGFGMGLAVPALTVLAAEHAPAGRRGQATALLGTATFGSQFGSPLLFGPVEAATSTSGVFLAAAALAALALLTLLVTGRRLGTEPPG